MLSINIPKEVKVISGVNFIRVEGPLGVIIKQSSKVKFIIKDTRLYCLSGDDNNLKQTYLAIMRGILFGVSKGYRRKLRLVGVGFKALIKETNLILKIGFSHEIFYNIPKDVVISTSKNKGVIIVISGIENVRVNQVAVEIRRLRIPDIYKGKGIHYNKEVLKLKKGKREGK
jgi:large subunit ribosomal protein L6